MRLDPKERTEQLLDAALKLAVEHGWRGITHDMIARATDVSRGLVVARLGTMEQIRRSVMRAAVRNNCARVVAEGLAAGDKHAKKAGPELREIAAKWVSQA